MTKLLKTILILIIIIILIIIALFIWPKLINNGDVDTEDGVFDIDTSEWVSYRNEGYGYSFKCPREWEIEEYTSEDSIIETVRCSIQYDNLKYSFEDGVYTLFMFMPKKISEQKTVDTIELIKNHKNAQEYSNNSFNGWFYLKDSEYELKLMARNHTDDGYYEAEAWSVASSDTKKDQQDRKKMIDNIISTFEITK